MPRPKKPTFTEALTSDMMRVPGWLKGVLVTLLIALLGWAFTGYVRMVISNEDAGIRTDIAVAIGKLDLMFDTTLKRAATAKEPEDIKAAQELLTLAQSRGVKLNPQTITYTGQQLLNRASDPEAPPGTWQAATVFADYRTFLNASLAPQKPPPTERTGSDVLVQEGRVIEFDQSYIHDITITLDRGKYIRSLIKNCVVRYEGGPVVIDDSGFENCRFEFAQTENSRLVLDAILKSSVPKVVIDGDYFERIKSGGK